MDVDDASSSSAGSDPTGPLDEWQGIWDFDWQVTGGGCPSLFASDTRFVKVRWVGAGQLMFIYDADWDGEFDDRLLKELEDNGFHVNQQELDTDD